MNKRSFPSPKASRKRADPKAPVGDLPVMPANAPAYAQDGKMPALGEHADWALSNPVLDPKRWRNRSILFAILPRPIKGLINSFLNRCRRAETAVLERFASTERKRHFSAMTLAILLNFALLSSMALFGKFRIFIPNAPPSTVNISLVSQAADPIYPTLRDPSVSLEPEPTPEEPEIIPEIEPEPEPEPVEPLSLIHI